MAYISLHSTKRESPVLFSHSVHDAIVRAYEFVPVKDEVWSVTDGAQAYNFNVMHTGLGAALTNAQRAWDRFDAADRPQHEAVIAGVSTRLLWFTASAVLALIGLTAMAVLA